MGCFSSKSDKTRPVKYERTPAGLANAEREYRKILVTQREKHSTDQGHRDILDTLSALNRILDERGKHREAAKMRDEIRDALEEKRRPTRITST